MTGLRAANFSSGQGIAYMHESLYAAVGKRLTYVLNMGCRAMTKATLNVHAGHDDYHCVDDTGFFQLFAKTPGRADLNLVAHRIAELALNPGIVAQDGFLTTHLIESLLLPERELVAEYLGRPEDIIECPTPAQRMLFGDPAPRAGAVGRGQPGDGRRGAEPGRLHAERGGAAAVLLRPHPRSRTRPSRSSRR
jgi:pyruvate-ferredoxin/flavodoxin oxidoreductase